MSVGSKILDVIEIALIPVMLSVIASLNFDNIGYFLVMEPVGAIMAAVMLASGRMRRQR